MSVIRRALIIVLQKYLKLCLVISTILSKMLLALSKLVSWSTTGPVSLVTRTAKKERMGTFKSEKQQALEQKQRCLREAEKHERAGQHEIAESWKIAADKYGDMVSMHKLVEKVCERWKGI